MSQDVSINEREKAPLTASTLLQPWSAEADAEQLMDDLFADIDRILEGGSKLPTEPAQPEYISLQSIVVPPITMPPVLISPPELPDQSPSVTTEAATINIAKTTETQNTRSHPQRAPWYRHKWVWMLSLVSLVGFAALLWAMQNRSTWGWLNFAAVPSTQTQPLSEADAQFIAYMQRSLNAIDNKLESQQKTASATGAGSNTAAIPGVVPGSSLTSSNRPSTYIDKYIVNNNYTTYPIEAAPVPSGSSTKTSQSAAANVTTPAPSASGLSTRASTTPNNTPPVPPPPPLEIPSLSAAPAPASTAKLVGLLEQGENSAALFEIDNITQRINIGEAIGASGWMLVSVANKEAVIRRNGEVRSVYVGQTF